MALKNTDGDSSNPWRQAGLALSIPTMMVSGPIVGFLLGMGINRVFGITPPWERWVKVVCLVLGLIAGGRETVRVIRRISSDTE